MIATQCNCCREDVSGALYISTGVGQVCSECAKDLRTAAISLHKAGFVKLYFGQCGDNDGEEAK